MAKSTYSSGQPIFSQLINLLPKSFITKAARNFEADRYCKKFDTYHHLITMLYAVFQHCTSLREVVTGMKACEGRLQPLGLKHLPARSTLSEANERRNYQVFEEIYFGLYNRYQSILADSLPQGSLKRRLILIDSTTISLFKEILKNAGSKGANGKRKGGIKVHMAVRAHEDIPQLIKFTAAAAHDVPFMRQVAPAAGSIVVMDRAYQNFQVLNQWMSNKVEWVTRLKSNSVYSVLQQMEVSEEQRSKGVISDQLILMGTANNKAIQQVKCRLVTYNDSIRQYKFQFVTSIHSMTALMIADIYKQRWQIEMLFKRLKQNMPLQYFLGDNENAIKVQIFCALIADLLLKIVTTSVKRKWAFSNLAAFIRLHLMNYTDVKQFLQNPDRCRIYNPPPLNPQLQLLFSG